MRVLTGLRFGLVGVVMATLGLWAQPANIVVTSGASFEPGIPSPGSIGTIFCTGVRGSAQATTAVVPLPIVLAVIRVSIAGTPAPLFAIIQRPGRYQQINFQAPREPWAALPDRTVTVEQDGQVGSNNQPAERTTPGDFFLYSNGQAIFTHASNYLPVTREDPATPGEYVNAWLTGMIPTEPRVSSGYPAPFDPGGKVSRSTLAQRTKCCSILMSGR